jgi:hypothetical protein
LIFLCVAALLVSSLANACRPAPASTGPNIDDIVATGRAGTQHAWTLGTIVSATQAALAGQAQTLPPPTRTLPPAPATVPADAALGDPCHENGKGDRRSYVDEREGFCLFYPGDFFVNKPAAGTVEFLGPALDKSAQPLRAYISVSRKERVSGRTLDEIALSVWKEPRGAFRMSNITLGGKDALVADDLVIGEAGWKVKQVIYTHGGFVYLISLSPVDSTPPYDGALPDIQRFWDLAIPAFTFR